MAAKKEPAKKKDDKKEKTVPSRQRDDKGRFIKATPVKKILAIEASPEAIAINNHTKNAKKKPRGRPFEPGNCANPKGRPKGSLNKNTQLAINAAELAWPQIEEGIKQGDKDFILFAAHMGTSKPKPGAGSSDAPAELIRKLMIACKEGKMTMRDAAFELAANNIDPPAAFRILLEKEEVEPEDITGGEYSTMSTPELEALKAEREAAIQAQRDGLPERRAEINELREQVADKFAPGAMPQKPKQENGEDNESQEYPQG